MQCVILAGGLATRMRPHTDKIPKSLLPVAGKPFLNFQLNWLAGEGVLDVVMCIGHLGEMIKEYAGDGSRWKLRLRYVDEGKNLRGTAGALRLAHQRLTLDPEFLILYGDSFLEIPIQPVWTFFKDQPEKALMTVMKNDNQWEHSNVRFDAPKVSLYEKNSSRSAELGMQFVDYGLSILRREVLVNEIPDGVKSDLADVFNRLSKRGDVAGYEVHQRFFEIGSPAGLADLERHLTEAK